MDINSVITEEEFNSIDISKVTYNQFCGFLMKLTKLSVEESLKALPLVMTHLAKQVTYLKELSDKFYSDNKDLDKHRGIVAKVIEKLEAANPGKPYEEILKLAAEESRKIISEIKTPGTKDPSQFNNRLKDL